MLVSWSGPLALNFFSQQRKKAAQTFSNLLQNFWVDVIYFFILCDRRHIRHNYQHLVTIIYKSCCFQDLTIQVVLPSPLLLPHSQITSSTVSCRRCEKYRQFNLSSLLLTVFGGDVYGWYSKKVYPVLRKVSALNRMRSPDRTPNSDCSFGEWRAYWPLRVRQWIRHHINHIKSLDFLTFNKLCQ